MLRPEQPHIPVQRIEAALAERVAFPKQAPRPGFDPLQASARELEAFKLPPRPDAKRNPRAFANWQRLMSPPLRFISQEELDRFADDISLAFSVSRTRRAYQLKAGGSATQASSRNWSGAYIQDDPAKQFVLIQARWTVPRPYPPPPVQAGGAWHAGTYHATSWIGLDGHAPGSLSLPQLGTAQIVGLAADGSDAAQLQVTTGAWWQWWVKGDPTNHPIDIPNAVFPVQPGDLIATQLDVLNPASVRFTLKNQSSGQLFPPFDVAAPMHQGSAATVEGRTAEWIVERPAQPLSSALLPFCDYGSLVFSGCNAAVSLDQGPPADRSLRDARLVRLADWTRNVPGTTDQPGMHHPGIIVSAASAAGMQAVLVQYAYGGG